MTKYLKNLVTYKLTDLAFDIIGDNYKFDTHQIVRELRCRLDRNLTNVNPTSIKSLLLSDIKEIISNSTLEWMYEYDRDDIHNDINPRDVVLEMLERSQ